MASQAVEGMADGSAFRALQLSASVELRSLVRQAADHQNVSTSGLLRRALIHYMRQADGIPPDLARAIEDCALRHDTKLKACAASEPVLRPSATTACRREG